MRPHTKQVFLIAVMVVTAVSARPTEVTAEDADYNDIQGDIEFALQEYLEQLLSQQPDVKEELERAVEEYIENNVPEGQKHSLQKRTGTYISTIINKAKKKTCLITLGILCFQVIG